MRGTATTIALMLRIPQKADHGSASAVEAVHLNPGSPAYEYKPPREDHPVVAEGADTEHIPRHVGSSAKKNKHNYKLKT